ncbi:hypothetical protein EVAR_50295_1 [Eumeta japonica]|uniref:Uncharacterized protein n=1 Tax=Eumeta variegata TaxID=151549 RepID=A0A4C1XPU1_EUMVA|nr:hypothetical protein EVAR_50295_1 [Eumeta japonica]
MCVRTGIRENGRHDGAETLGGTRSTRARCATLCCARGRPIIVEWERDARHSAGLSLVRAFVPKNTSRRCVEYIHSRVDRERTNGKRKSSALCRVQLATYIQKTDTLAARLNSLSETLNGIVCAMDLCSSEGRYAHRDFSFALRTSWVLFAVVSLSWRCRFDRAPTEVGRAARRAPRRPPPQAPGNSIKYQVHHFTSMRRLKDFLLHCSQLILSSLLCLLCSRHAAQGGACACRTLMARFLIMPLINLRRRGAVSWRVPGALRGHATPKYYGP